VEEASEDDMNAHRRLPGAISRLLGAGVRTEFYKLGDALASTPDRESKVFEHLESHPNAEMLTLAHPIPRHYDGWEEARAALPAWQPVRDELLRIIGPVPTHGIVNGSPRDPLEHIARKVCSMHLQGLSDVPPMLTHLKTIPAVP
jgi:hypothetical protein